MADALLAGCRLRRRQHLHGSARGAALLPARLTLVPLRHPAPRARQAGLVKAPPPELAAPPSLVDRHAGKLKKSGFIIPQEVRGAPWEGALLGGASCEGC